jgi:translation initiation factor 5B
MENTIVRQPIITVCGHVDHGKCVSGDTLIPLVNGTIITAKDLFENNFNNKEIKKIDDGLLQDISKKEIGIFSFDGKEIVNKNISHIWKRKAEKLIEIKLNSGDVIKTTPEHPFFILNGLEKTWKKANELEEKSYIAIPSKINLQNSDILQILINKIKTLNNFVCFIRENSVILEKLKNKNILDIERKLKLKNLRDSIKNKRFRVKDFFKLTSHLNIHDKEAYAMIDSIKNSNEGWRVGHTSKEMKLPNLNELEKFGYILGCITGDGHLSKNNIILNNNDKEIQENYQECLKKIFNINSKFKRAHTCDTIIDCSGMTFVRFVSEIIGIPKGNKSGIVSVPEIAKQNKEVFRGFFSGLLDTDGYISSLNNSIEITSKSKRLLKECSILLLNFSIHSVVYEKNKFYTLRIANKKYLDKFLQNFNPRLKRKLIKIIDASKKAETSRIFDFLPISGKFLKELKMPGKINKKIPYFSKYNKTDKISKWLIKSVLENIKIENETSQKLRSLFEQELDYVQIISKKEIKNEEEYVYDFTVPDTHNFIAEKVLVHNTSILDCLRDSSIQDGEKGGITQKISFTSYPASQLKKACPILDEKGIKINIPGFLLIDTPGHAAFTNLRKRGGALADLAVLVIDINEGIKPQTAEVIQILKLNKVPFLIALNKIDNISGWKQLDNDLEKSIALQPQRVKQVFEERYYTLIVALNSYGFEADLYFNIKDYTQKIALIPCSARTKEGIPELTMMLCGLSQKYLATKLELGKEARGIILEIKKEKSGNYIEAILYDGEFSKNDQIAVANLEGEPTITRIRVLEEIEPLVAKFKPKEKIRASTGFRMQLTEKIDVLPGMPFVVYKGNKEKIKEMFKKEISENIKVQNQGIIAKADSLGSLEALLTLLNQNHIPVLKASIGSINKSDIIDAKANFEINELDAVIVGFNTKIEDDAKEIKGNIKIITDDVIYKLIENTVEFRKEKSKEIEKRRLMELATISKIKLLHEFVFRNTKPAIFGVKIEGGKLRSGLPIIDEEGTKIGRVKNIQSENKSVEETSEGSEVAISIPGTNYERQLKNKNFLYSDLSESQFKKFKKNKDLLSPKEISILQEVAEIKRKEKADWGL